MQYVIILLVAFWYSPVLGQKEFTLNVHEIGDPDGLNPLISSAANAENIEDNLFCRLLEFNRETFQLEPALAVKRPIIETVKKGPYKGGMSLTYEIHSNATWDNGAPVTGHDYLFTIKAVKHQNVESADRRVSLEFIKNVVVDANNPKKFTIYTKKVSFMAEYLSGNLVHILPEHSYDPRGILKTVDIAKLDGNKAEYSQILNEFADDFNSAKYSSELAYVRGCGPYKITNWDIGGSITLERKKNWWGDEVKDNIYLKAYPTKIVYHIIPGMGWVLSKVKDGELDIVRNVPPQRFYEAKENDEYKKIVEFHDPSQFAYHYLAFNFKNPKLADKRVREAIACAVDRERIVNEFFGGEAIKVNTPISPHRMHYNIKLEGVKYDLEKSKSLLAKAGWKDTDGDDILDKKIDGKLVKLRLKYNYNKGNIVRKAIGEMVRKDLAKIGIKMDLYPVDFADLLDKANARNYEILALAWVNSPGSDGLKNVWHTSADTESGGNRVGFGTARTDRLIDDILITLDENKRKEMYLELQELIVAEHPYVFLVVPNQLIMIKKGFTYPNLGPVRPGYVDRWFQKQ